MSLPSRDDPVSVIGAWRTAVVERDGAELRVWNPRLRVVGFVWAGIGVLFVVSAPAAPDPVAVIWMAALAIVVVAMGFLWARGGWLRVRPQRLELRSAFRSKKLPLSDVDRCEARIGSQGLIYVRAYPMFVLKSGREIPFSVIQWPSERLDQASAVCQEITTAMRGEDATELLLRSSVIAHAGVATGESTDHVTSRAPYQRDSSHARIATVVDALGDYLGTLGCRDETDPEG